MNTASNTSPAPIVRSPALAVLANPKPANDLLSLLLREQQSMTAVDRFVSHEASAPPAQARYYRDLIPDMQPGPGQQYAFEVDLDACTGCKSCVTACHSLNGLDDTESFRNVGLIHGGKSDAGFQQTVTSSCHHCAEPACLTGCPVNAYEKDPITGIVKHLDDQCIGCQYCTLMCPYDAPKYNSARGIVRKCDMCSDRLSSGEAPACVQACPSEAIRIRIVDKADALAASNAGSFLPGAPGPQDTIPTTVYKTARPVPANALPADFYSVSPSHSHMPLVIMLVLTQLAVGAFSFAHLLPKANATTGGPPLSHALFALVLAGLALVVSPMHLGRPLLGYRAFLGLRHSWLSREIIAFGTFAPLASAYALLVSPLAGASLKYSIVARYLDSARIESLRDTIGVATIAMGGLGVFCSVMVYAATKRPHWGAALTGYKFFITTAVLGASAAFMLSVLTNHEPAESIFSATKSQLLMLVIVMTSAIAKLSAEAIRLRHFFDKRTTSEKRVATLMIRDLGLATVGRFATGAMGGIVLAGILWLSARPGGQGNLHNSFVHVTAVASFVLLLGSELLERFLFFKAAPASRMPGGLT